MGCYVLLRFSASPFPLSVLLLLFQELSVLALQVVSVVAYYCWCTCRRHAPNFGPSHFPHFPGGFCFQFICFWSAVFMPLLTSLVFQLKFLMKMDFCWDDKPWVLASEPCTCAACAHPPTHLVAVGAVTAQAVSAACLVNANLCGAAWFLGSIDSAGLCFVHPPQNAYSFTTAVPDCWWQLTERKQEKSDQHNNRPPHFVTKFAAVTIMKTHLFTSRAEQFSGETAKEEPNKAIFRWALHNITLKIFKLWRKSVIALIGGDGDSSLVFSVFPECARLGVLEIVSVCLCLLFLPSA